MTLPAVIASVPSQLAQVNRMVKFCRDLDGTELNVIDVDDSQFSTPYPRNAFPCRQSYAFRCAAHAMRGAPFIWVEADSTPLKKGWAKALTKEYVKKGKPFLLTSDSYPPHDMTGGIGVYHGDSHWLIPQNFQKGAWDAWMLKHMKEVTATTPLIQHSYGVYEGANVTDVHRFPRDAAMLRPGAVIFHRDKFQTLIPRKSGSATRFLHTGDMGDIIAAMPSIKALGGGELVISTRPKGQREPVSGARFEFIKPLLLSQPYITSVVFEESPDGYDYDFSTFRETRWNRKENLAEWQARHIGIEINLLNPWLENITPSKASMGRVVVARSPRYNNPMFPWKTIVQTYGPRIMFVGLPAEYDDFIARYSPHKLPYYPMKNMLEMAETAAGADRVICNQTCMFWVAAGVCAPIIQETWDTEPNSIIKRDNIVCETDPRKIKL